MEALQSHREMGCEQSPSLHCSGPIQKASCLKNCRQDHSSSISLSPSQVSVVALAAIGLFFFFNINQKTDFSWGQKGGDKIEREKRKKNKQK